MPIQSQFNTSPMLTVKHASKTYNGVPALIDVSLEIAHGEVHALVGENGAGKSTLIKLLAGVLHGDNVELAANGEVITIRDAASAFKHGLRFIHQELNVVPHLSIAENIFLSHKYPTRFRLAVDWSKLYENAQAVLNALGITHLDVRQHVARLSPGEQMLVCIARAFAGDELQVSSSPLIYIMDEPTAALTGKETEMLFSVIARLRDQGSAVLYVSHRLEEIFKICNRVTVLRDGQVVCVSNTSDISPTDLIRKMTGRSMHQVYPLRDQPVGSEVVLKVNSLRTVVVKDVTFELKRGEIIGVAGLIGSGRTELLRSLVGLDRLSGGEIWLNGNKLSFRSASQAWREGIALIPEERRSQGLVVSRSIVNNVTLPQLRHLSRNGWVLDYNQERELTLKLGQRVRLKSRGPEQVVRQLSGGNQQKVLFARALAHPLHLLLLDEPTRGVDVGAKTDIYQIIRQISNDGTGVVIVSSDLPELIGLADRILIMRNRQLVNTLVNSNVTPESLLGLCYGEISYDRG